MTVYVVTTTFMHTEESEDPGTGHPLQTIEAFRTYQAAWEFAIEQANENNLDEERSPQMNDDQTGWEVRNDYETVYVEIHSLDPR